MWLEFRVRHVEPAGVERSKFFVVIQTVAGHMWIGPDAGCAPVATRSASRISEETKPSPQILQRILIAIMSSMTDKAAIDHTGSNVLLSAVVPIYNEADNISPFFDRLNKILDALGETYEIICVDDGSTDESVDLLVAERSRNPSVKIVRLSRNFGKESAHPAAAFAPEPSR